MNHESPDPWELSAVRGEFWFRVLEQRWLVALL